MEALGRDFVMQDEVVPGFGDEGDKMPLPEAAPEVDASSNESVEAPEAPLAESAMASEVEVAEVVDLPSAESDELASEPTDKVESGS